MDIIISDFYELDLDKICRIPIITVYHNTEEYRGKYIARLWDLGRLTSYVVVKDNLDDILDIIPISMHILSPLPGNDKTIIGVWA